MLRPMGTSGRMRLRLRLAAVLLAVVALAGWRLALAEHVHEHDATDDQLACELCAHAHASGAGLPAPGPAALPAAPDRFTPQPPTRRAAATALACYLARAPPRRLA